MQRMFSSRRSYFQWHKHLPRKTKIILTSGNSELKYQRQDTQVCVDCMSSAIKRSLV